MIFKKILLFNPMISSLNLGDHIIYDSFKNELGFILNESFVSEISTHLPISNYLSNFRSFDYRFVCGSNLIRGKMNKSFRQWDINLCQVSLLKPLILVGVGWWQYGDEPNLYSKILYKNILSKKYIHSVRDEYTKNQFTKMGIYNVVNTGCPTMWKLTKSHCNSIPLNKSSKVVFTLTDYNQDSVKDKKLIEYCLKNYKEVFFWPQGSNDIDYFNKLNVSHVNLTILNPTLSKYDEFLNSSKDIDYIGTRLHAGIRALQFKKRSIIIGIDNRSLEKKKDFNLVVLPREEIDKLDLMINQSFQTNIKLNNSEIKTWISQFKKKN